jgi:hypothetical protein
VNVIVAERSPSEVENTRTAPAAWAAAVNVKLVGLVTATSEAGTVVPPMVTVVIPGMKPVPVIVTKVPPVLRPAPGPMDVTLGAAGT